MHTLSDLAQHVLAGGLLDRAGALRLVEAGRCEPAHLLEWAGKVRAAHFGVAVSLCEIVAGKLGSCSEDCKWCAQSAHWASSKPPAGAGKSGCASAGPRYAESAEFLAAADQAVQARAGRLGIVNSGRRPTRTDIERIAQAVAGIKQRHPGLIVCASLGELDARQARQLAQAGVDRYHHNLETSERFFGRMVSTHGYQDRLATLAHARDAGMSVCSGGLLGLGEDWTDRVDLALVLRDRVGPASVPINFLTPIPGTPLERWAKLDPAEALAIIAVWRLIMPRADLRVCGGRLAVLGDQHERIFQAGASSCMTGNYLTTAGHQADDDLAMLGRLGLHVVAEHGGQPGGMDQR